MPRGTLYGIQTLGDHGLAKVRDACTTGVVDEDVWLAKRHYGNEEI